MTPEKPHSLQPRIRWRRLLVILVLVTPMLTFPIWHRLLFPDFW